MNCAERPQLFFSSVLSLLVLYKNCDTSWRARDGGQGVYSSCGRDRGTPLITTYCMLPVGAQSTDLMSFKALGGSLKMAACPPSAFHPTASEGSDVECRNTSAITINLRMNLDLFDQTASSSPSLWRTTGSMLDFINIMQHYGIQT